MFVADRATFTIELTCKRGVDILSDDLSGDKLKLEGLELVGSDSSRDSGRDGTTIYRFHYVVTTYRVDTPAMTIGPLAVRYAATRPGQRLEEAPPAGEVPVPRASIAMGVPPRRGRRSSPCCSRSVSVSSFCRSFRRSQPLPQSFGDAAPVTSASRGARRGRSVTRSAPRSTRFAR